MQACALAHLLTPGGSSVAGHVGRQRRQTAPASSTSSRFISTRRPPPPPHSLMERRCVLRLINQMSVYSRQPVAFLNGLSRVWTADTKNTAPPISTDCYYFRQAWRRRLPYVFILRVCGLFFWLHSGPGSAYVRLLGRTVPPTNLGGRTFRPLIFTARRYA